MTSFNVINFFDIICMWTKLWDGLNSQLGGNIFTKEMTFQIMLQIMAKLRQFIVFSKTSRDNCRFQHTCLTLNAAWTAGRCAICAANWRFLAVAALPVGLMFFVIARADGAVSALTLDNFVNLYCKKKPYHIILHMFCSTTFIDFLTDHWATLWSSLWEVFSLAELSSTFFLF